jgi:chromate transporter
VRSGVTALILLAAVKLGKSVIKDLFSVLIAAAAFIALVVFDLHAIIVILLSAVLGFLWYSLAKARRSL